MLAIDSSPQIAIGFSLPELSCVCRVPRQWLLQMGNTEIHFDRGRPIAHRSSTRRYLLLRSFLSLLRGLVEKLGIPIGSAISASRFSQGLGWLVAIFLGFYYVLILTAVFLLAIQGIGLAHSFADKRIEAW
jgi:hypothetical protein